ncbi:hypothetical protein GCM10023321_79450 [Pseudonocardia eucalypti]|uniref:Uncharacterized protein n=1 Tax=Pseudonocardia eucalypti TaxID=648755 RepID=A0ABP9RDR3_9PSEU
MMNPPSGRARKPTAKVANAASAPTSELVCGKNSFPITNAAAAPYSAKSYHSMTVPTVLAATARLISCWSGTCAVRSAPIIGTLVVSHNTGQRILSTISLIRQWGTQLSAELPV